MRVIRKYSYYLLSIFELLGGFKNPFLIARVFLGLPAAQPVMVRLRRSGLRFHVRGAMDVWSIKETFLDRFYERCGFTIQPGWTVIDVGAGLGDFTLFAAVQEGTRVYAFEPFPGSFDLLRQNLELNQARNASIFPEAVGSSDGNLTLDLRGGEPLQFQSRAAPVTTPESQISVRTRSLAGVFDGLDLESCDLLKLDCEGAEYGILFNAPPELLQKIQRIVLEFHEQVTEYTRADLVRFLQAQGYEVDVFDNAVHANLGYLRAAR
jgi:FkbM family methyltransferase